MPRLPKPPPFSASGPSARGSVDEVEQQFYEAMRRADLDALMALWTDDDDVFCVHPGGVRVIGPAAVRASFEGIFANGPVDVHPERVRRVQALGFAVHSVLECVQVSTPQGKESGWVVASNVYVATAQGWRIVAHHASPGTQRPPQDGTEATGVLH